MPKKISNDAWERVRLDYTTGITNGDGEHVFPTLAELAKKHGISQRAVDARSSKEGWRHHRSVSKAALQKRIDAERIKQMVILGGEVDLRTLGVAGRLMDKIDGMIDDVEKPSHVATLARAATDVQKVMKLALGQAQTITRQAESDVDIPAAFASLVKRLEFTQQSIAQGGDQVPGGLDGDGKTGPASPAR